MPGVSIEDLPSVRLVPDQEVVEGTAATLSSFRVTWYTSETITRTGFQQTVMARQTTREQEG
ncbi:MULTISPECIES: hypothetical protein [unclassified Streptomyces]|uniref:hypothetical protein n=1 Tax=unclassified Streptomyces TaxID=2593676 RepID=UPI00336A205F